MEEKEVNLCDTCDHVKEFPVCMETANVSFSLDPGKDNIIGCSRHSILGAKA